MSELYEKSQSKLELNQVLDLLAACAGSADGKAACLAIKPSSDIEQVQCWLDETSAASNLSTSKGYPGFGGLTDVAASLDRAYRGGSLQPRELLLIAGVLRCARTVKTYITESEPDNILGNHSYSMRFERTSHSHEQALPLTKYW